MSYDSKVPKDEDDISKHNTTYSDGIILKPEGNSTCRMVFFERRLKTNQKTFRNFENEGEKVIQYEIRVPFEVVAALYSQIGLMKQNIDKKMDIKSKFKDTPQINLDNWVYDTSEGLDVLKEPRLRYLGWSLQNQYES